MDMSYPNLAKYLASFDAEYAYEEIVSCIHDFSPQGRYGHASMPSWTCEEAVHFMQSLEFVQPFTNTITSILEQECVDGQVKTTLVKLPIASHPIPPSFLIPHPHSFLLLVSRLPGRGQMDLQAGPAHREVRAAQGAEP